MNREGGRCMGNGGFTNDQDGLFIDNNVFDQKKTSIAVAASALDFDQSAFEMEDAVCGTEAMLLLANQWFGVTQTTVNYKKFYSEHVDPFVSKVNESINDVNSSISDSLLLGKAEPNNVLEKAAKENNADEQDEVEAFNNGVAKGIKYIRN